MAEVAARSRRDAAGNPHAQVSGSADLDELLAEDYVRSPLRRHDLPPITDGAARRGAGHRATEPASWSSARRTSRLRRTARSATTRPPGPRRLAVDRHRGRGGRRRPRPGRGGRAAGRASPTRSCCCAGSSASATTWPSNPSGGALAANPIMATGLVPHRPRRPTTSSTAASRAAGARDVGPVPAAEPRLHPGGPRA